MRFSESYRDGQFGLSFEVFPPKTEQGHATLMRRVGELLKFSPQFITCTYGAGGSTRDKTLNIISAINDGFAVSTATHLTCVSSTTDQLRDYLARAVERGIENIVALRGDPPRGEDGFQVAEGGLRYASQLVELIRSEYPDLGIAVAGYPECHQEAESPAADLEHLKHKVECGADVILTQLFYANDDFFRFRDRCEQLGITTPIVPGLLPVTNLAQIQRITSLCGAKLPAPFVADLEANSESPEGQFEVGVAQAIAQTEQLLAAGVPGIHFYVLNQSHAATRVLDAVSLRS